MKKLFFFVAVMIVFTGCKNEPKNTVIIKGKVNNYDDGFIFIEKVLGPSVADVDTVTVQPDDSFIVKISTDQPSEYRLNFNYRTKVPVLVANSDMNIIVDASKRKNNHTIKNSPDHDLIYEAKAIQEGFEEMDKIQDMKKRYEIATKMKDSAAIAQINENYKRALEEKNKLIKEMLMESIDQGHFLGVIQLLYDGILTPADNLEFFEEVAVKLKTNYPESKAVSIYNSYVATLKVAAKTYNQN